MLRLNILDQSPVIEGKTYSDAIQQTIELAVLADKLGYYRYWVAEHHSTNSFASASPEILIPIIASNTKRIRVGSGGVLISHYSPLKIAEQFNMLQSLFSGRIDLGIGRAPGGDSEVMKALKGGNENAFDKTTELIEYLGNYTENKSSKKVKAVPQVSEKPEIWILGTSPESAVYAAENGLPYTFGSFISDEHMIKCFSSYYNYFKPSIYLKQPRLNLALFVIAAETDEAAEKTALCSQYWLTQTFLQGKNIPFPDKQKSIEYKFSVMEKILLEERKKSAIICNADDASKKLKEIAEQYALHELTLVTITSRFEDRKDSYRLIAERILN
ncbi:MAG: hypothetical protein HGGPFJEG_00267 [Ignavibacteria bacterium]|nr:hypothetical protein [Ignavibacteria bacterium]